MIEIHLLPTTCIEHVDSGVACVKKRNLEEKTTQKPRRSEACFRVASTIQNFEKLKKCEKNQIRAVQCPYACLTQILAHDTNCVEKCQVGTSTHNDQNENSAHKDELLAIFMPKIIFTSIVRSALIGVIEFHEIP